MKQELSRKWRQDRLMSKTDLVNLLALVKRQDLAWSDDRRLKQSWVVPLIQ